MSDFLYRLEKMQDLMEDIMQIEQENVQSMEAVKQATKIVSNSGKIVESSHGQMEMSYDVQIFGTGQNIFRNVVQNLDSNLIPFTIEDFSNGVSYFFSGKKYGPDAEWDVLSKVTFPLVKASSRIEFKLGTFELEPPPKPEKVARERAKRPEKTKKELVKALVEDENKKEKDPKKFSDHMVKCLVQSYRSNNQKPVNYFNFVLNPDDFWMSVHNVYQMAQLVKDEKVNMLIVNGLPVIEPNKQSESKHIRQRSQFNFRLTPKEYRDLLQTFQITRAAVPPL